MAPKRKPAYTWEYCCFPTAVCISMNADVCNTNTICVDSHLAIHATAIMTCLCVFFFTTSKDFWSHIWCHSVDGTTYPIKSVCGMLEEETLNTIPESQSQSGPITAMSGSGQAHSGTSHSFYCLPDCHGRFANLRTWEELVLLTLTITSRFQSELAPSSLFPATTLGGHGSLKRLLVNSCWRVDPQILVEREGEKVRCVNRADLQCEESPGSGKVLQAALVQRAKRGDIVIIVEYHTAQCSKREETVKHRTLQQLCYFKIALIIKY